MNWLVTTRELIHVHIDRAFHKDTFSLHERPFGAEHLLLTLDLIEHCDRNKATHALIARVEVLLQAGLELVSITDKSAHLRTNGNALYSISNSDDHPVAPGQNTPPDMIVPAHSTIYLWRVYWPYYNDRRVSIEKLTEGQ